MKLIILLLATITLTACKEVTVGKMTDDKLKGTNGNSWGNPVGRPVTWGYNGIDRNCDGDCKADSKSN